MACPLYSPLVSSSSHLFSFPASPQWFYLSFLFHFFFFLSRSSGPNYGAVECVYCSTHRSLGLLLLCASEAHKRRMEWKRMCALHKLWLIGLKESGGDKKGRGRRKRERGEVGKGGDVLLWNKLGKKSAALHFLNWPAEIWEVVLLFYSNTDSHYRKNFYNKIFTSFFYLGWVACVFLCVVSCRISIFRFIMFMDEIFTLIC